MKFFLTVSILLLYRFISSHHVKLRFLLVGRKTMYIFDNCNFYSIEIRAIGFDLFFSLTVEIFHFYKRKTRRKFFELVFYGFSSVEYFIFSENKCKRQNKRGSVGKISGEYGDLSTNAGCFLINFLAVGCRCYGISLFRKRVTNYSFCRPSYSRRDFFRHVFRIFISVQSLSRSYSIHFLSQFIILFKSAHFFSFTSNSCFHCLSIHLRYGFRSFSILDRIFSPKANLIFPYASV